MIDIKPFLKMMNQTTGRDTSIPDSRIMHPMREWLTGLTGVIIGVVCGSVFALSQYRSYSSSTNTEIVVSETVVPYKAALVDKALKTYLEKKAVYESLLGTTVITQEPTDSSSSTVPVAAPEATTSSDVVAPLKEEVIEEVEPVTDNSTPDLAI